MNWFPFPARWFILVFFSGICTGIRLGFLCFVLCFVGLHSVFCVECWLCLWIVYPWLPLRFTLTFLFYFMEHLSYSWFLLMVNFRNVLHFTFQFVSFRKKTCPSWMWHYTPTMHCSTNTIAISSLIKYIRNQDSCGFKYMYYLTTLFCSWSLSVNTCYVILHSLSLFFLFPFSNFVSLLWR
jgi:hypothetical protein